MKILSILKSIQTKLFKKPKDATSSFKDFIADSSLLRTGAKTLKLDWGFPIFSQHSSAHFRTFKLPEGRKGAIFVKAKGFDVYFAPPEGKEYLTKLTPGQRAQDLEIIINEIRKALREMWSPYLTSQKSSNTTTIALGTGSRDIFDVIKKAFLRAEGVEE